MRVIFVSNVFGERAKTNVIVQGIEGQSYLAEVTACFIDQEFRFTNFISSSPGPRLHL